MIYEDCLSAILYHEGGYYDGSLPRDPNPTNKGITQNTYDDYRRSKGHDTRPVRYVSDDEVRDIYFTRYWRDGKCFTLPTGVSLVHFDFCVNAGITQAAKTLQRVVGAEPDGIIGPKTLARIDALSPQDLVFDYSQARRKFYESLAAKKPNLKPNLKGWLKRVSDIERRAVKALRGTSSSITTV